jgi:hypothetical protein
MAQAHSSWVILDNLMISVVTTGTMGDELWERFLRDLSTKPVTKYLAATLGRSEATSVQRKNVADISRAKGIRTAVVTDDGVVRGFVTAVSWLGANMRAFPWANANDALTYLEVTGPAAQRALAELAKLRTTAEAALRSQIK